MYKAKVVCLLSVIILCVVLAELYITHLQDLHHRKIKNLRNIRYIIPEKNTSLTTQFDSHLEYTELDKYGQLQGLLSKHMLSPRRNHTTVAIGCAFTSHGIDSDVRFIGQTFPFFRTFLPSFCKTASPSFDYHIYLAYDTKDKFMSGNNSEEIFMTKLNEIRQILCAQEISLAVHFVRCRHSSKPAWAQNDAMMEAYLDNMAYYYRINDDTSLNSPGWTELFIEALASLDPANIGVVGPNHRGGNEFILTHDFVHETHINIFGFYYPRRFTDWYADDWISYVYQPRRMKMLSSVQVVHTSERGTRYNRTELLSLSFIDDQVNDDRKILDRYIISKNEGIKGATNMNGTKMVISMSLYGQDSKYVYGAIRNAQLTPVIYPGWKLRIYVEKPSNESYCKYGCILGRILQKLVYLGVELVYVDTNRIKVAPMMWRFLVADDHSVDVFIVRDSDSRLSQRDHQAVKNWLQSGRSFHCVRDHPSHMSAPVFGGLWGARSKELRKFVNIPFHLLMHGIGTRYSDDIFFMANMIWPRVKEDAFCHDSIACNKYPGSRPFPSERQGYEHVGQIFDEYDVPMQIDIDVLKQANLRQYCNERPDMVVQNRMAQPDVPDVTNAPSVTLPDWLKDIKVFSVSSTHSPVVEDIKAVLELIGVQFLDHRLDKVCDNESCTSNLKVFNEHNINQLFNSNFTEMFYEAYRNDSSMESVTHFLCVSPPAICQLFLDFKQSKILISHYRYEEMFAADADSWVAVDKLLYTLSWDEQNVIGANNFYDKEYIHYYTGLRATYIPSYCSGASHVTYTPTKDSFLVMPIANAEFRTWFLQNLRDLPAELGLKFVYAETFNSSQASHYRALIVVPDDVTSLDICKLYRVNLPLFLPSLQLLIEWHKTFLVLERKSVHKNAPLEDVRGRSSRRYNPNDEVDDTALSYWLRYSDFFKWPYIEHFDSFGDLHRLLQVTNLPSRSYDMSLYNTKLKADIQNQWIDLLQRTRPT